MVIWDENTYRVESSSVSVDLEGTSLREGEKTKFKEFWDKFSEIFSNKPGGLIHVVWHEIDTGSAVPVASKPYRYDQMKQSIIDYHINKMLQDDIIMSIIPRLLHKWCCVEKIMGRVLMFGDLLLIIIS